MNVSLYTEFYKALKLYGIEKAAELSACAGADSVEMIEIRGTDLIPDEKSASHAREVIEKRGLCVSCYSLAIDLIPFDSSGNIVGTSEIAESIAARAAKLAKILGSPYFHHTLATNLSPELHLLKPTYDEMFEAFADSASRIAEVCNSMGLTVLYEPQGFYFNGNEGFGRFYREMKRRGYDVGVCGDMANVLFVDESPLEFYKEFAHEFRHVHVKDYRKMSDDEPYGRGCLLSRNNTKYRETHLGNGEVNFLECMKILKSTGYDGAFSLEINCGGEDVAEECRRLINTVKDNY